MATYKLIKMADEPSNYTNDPFNITIEFSGADLTTMLEGFEYFLSACGFISVKLCVEEEYEEEKKSAKKKSKTNA